MKVKAAFKATAALAEAIRDLGSVPSGHLYATVMGHMDLQTYESFIQHLVGAKLVRQDPSYLLTWIGPEEGEESETK